MGAEAIISIAASITQKPYAFPVSPSSGGSGTTYWEILKTKVVNFVSDTAMRGDALTQSAPMASRFDLRVYAEARIARLIATGHYDYTQASRQRVTTILEKMLVENGATPQVGATPDNSLEINWLVNGVFASVIIERDGYVSISAEIADQELEFEFEPHEELEFTDAFQAVCQIVADMTAFVSRRPDDWSGGSIKLL